MISLLLVFVCVSFDNLGCVAWQVDRAGGEDLWIGPTAPIQCEIEKARREADSSPLKRYECDSGSVHVETMKPELQLLNL